MQKSDCKFNVNLLGFFYDVGTRHPHSIDQAKEHTQTGGKTNGINYKHHNLIIMVKCECNINQMYAVQNAGTKQTNKA